MVIFKKLTASLLFSFLEGNLIKALKEGSWVLIDEVNLSSNEVLQKIIPILDNESILIQSRGDL